MKRFDLCIIDKNNISDLNGAYAIILDEDIESYYHVEIWNFNKNEGAEIDYISKTDLRLASSDESKDFQVKFKNFCIDNEI